MTKRQSTELQGKTVLTPVTDIVASTAPELRAQMKAALADGARELAVDLAAVRMIDSTGIGLLVAAHNSLAKSGGALVIVNAQPDLLGLFKSLRLDQHFSIAGAEA